jgi:trk system potassium uptake protein TrkH
MNKKYVFFLFGRIAQTIALLLLLPALVAVIYNEYKCLSAFLATAIFSAVLGTVIALLCRSHDRVIYAKEGFAIVAIAWLGLSLIGCLPFVMPSLSDL